MSVPKHIVALIDAKNEEIVRLEREKAEMLEVLEKLSSLLVDGEEYVPLELREEMITAVRKARGEG